MAVTVKEFEAVKVDVEKHEKWIYGNGEPGAKTDICMMKDQLARINKATGWIIGACITVITSILIWLFTTVLPKTLTHISLALK